MINSEKKAKQCVLFSNTQVNGENFILRFGWDGTVPRAGQFFMIKPLQSGVFLPRAISVNEYANGVVKFLITKVGKGTIELSMMKEGSQAELIGPLGNSWLDFIDIKTFKKIALISGGAGVAPLSALLKEVSKIESHFYAGFKNPFRGKEEAETILGNALNAEKLVVAFENCSEEFSRKAAEELKGTEDKRNEEREILSFKTGFITDFFDKSEKYDAVFSCGPFQMLRAVKELCEKASLPCFISLDRRMACGVGACLGCTVKTKNGNKRCCADGPIFNSREVIF